MLFEKKRTQQIKEALQEVLGETFIQQERKLLQSQAEQTNSIYEYVEKNQKAIRKLSDTIEDFLDTLQEENEEIQQSQQIIRENMEREHQLLGVIGLYQEQMELLDQWINGQSEGNSEAVLQAWKQQYNMLKGQVATERKFCTIESIGVVGETVDYRLHEILQAVETEDKGLEGTVAKVCSQGMLYRGKVVKKARVMAYRKHEENIERRVIDGYDNRD